MKYINIIILVFFSICASQNTAVVSDVKVSGNNNLTDNDILRISRIYEGMEIKTDELQQGIKRLWRQERFNDVQILLLQENVDGISIEIIVEEAPILKEIDISGNKKIKAKKIIEVGELVLGQVFTNNKLFDAVDEIKKEYKDRNYHNIQIEYSFLSGKLILGIKEGKKLKIKKILFKGNNDFSDSKLKRLLKENKEWKIFFPWRGKLKKNELEAEKLLISQFYHNKGYYDFHFVNHEIIESVEDSGLRLVFNVYEGQKYHYGKIDWTGNKEYDKQKLDSYLGFSSGDLYNKQKFIISVYQNISSLYMDQGFFYFQIDPKITPKENNLLDVDFILSENNLVTVRRIIIKGNEKTNENVIRRELDIFPGDVFNRQKFFDNRIKIMLLNLFENVIPDVQPVGEDEVDLIIEVLEKGVGQATFSMGWNKVQGFNGGGGFQLPNFRGKGQMLSFNYNRGVSGNSSGFINEGTSDVISQRFSISFFEPAIFDTPNMAGISINFSQTPSTQTYYGLDTEGASISLSFGKRKLRWPDDKFRVTWSISNSLKKYFGQSPDEIMDRFVYVNVADSDIGPDGSRYVYKSRGVSLSQVLKRKSLNHPEFPTTGSEFIWNFTYSGGFFGGNEHFVKNQLRFNWFIPISPKISIGNLAKVGAINKTSDDGLIPLQRFFVMGGSGIPSGEMLRGYPESSLGRYFFEDNTVVGAKLMARYSIEARMSFSSSPTIYGFVFAEAGNVWNGFETIDPFNLKRSAGVGIRLFVPMLGMIGYDIGYGFDSSINGDNQPWGWDHHLIFGGQVN